jgi:putative ABC transport system permease protein
MWMNLKMGWRNIWRNPRRSILTIGAISFATLLLVFMLSWQFGSYETMINSAVRTHTGHLQVQAEGYHSKQSIHLVVSRPDRVGALLEDMPDIAAYTFRDNAFSLASSTERAYGVLVIGIDPRREAEVSTLKKLVREGAYLSDGDSNQALVGKLLANNLKVSIGDEIVLLGQGRDGSIAATVVKVKGIFRSGEDKFDRSCLHIPLHFFQDTYAMRGAVHEVVAVCTSLESVPVAKKRLTEEIIDLNEKEPLVVLDWRELMPGLVQAIRLDLASGFIFYLILIVVVAFSILNTFLMAIFERTREFGIMMAIGAAPSRLTKILLIESATMAAVGIALGIVMGSLLTWYFQVHGILISGASEMLRQFGLPERMYPRLSMLSVSTGAGIVFVITILTILYPALKVRRFKPVEAMAAV